MAKLILHSVGWKNFLSTGSAGTEIQLDQHKTTLICGATGSGKTSISDAICFTWFNRALRDINKSQLVNTITNGGTETFTVFSIGNNKYKVLRGIKPNKLEITVNGVQLDLPAGKDPQDWLESLLGFTYKTCKHVILLGNASFTPFMQMKALERRELVEDLRNLDIFSAMSKIAKVELDKLNKTFGGYNSEVMVLNNKIEMLNQFITESEQNTTDQKKQIFDDIATQNALLHYKRAERVRFIEQGVSLSNTFKGVPATIKAELDALLLSKRDAQEKKNRLTKSINEFDQLTICVTCKQVVGEEHKHSIHTQVEKSIVKIDSGLTLIDVDINALKEQHEYNQTIKVQLDEIRGKIQVIDQEIKQAVSFVAKYEQMISNIDKSGEGVEVRKVELEKSKSTHQIKEIELIGLSEEISVLQECQRHLKDDGIKASLIDQFIPIFNSLVNKYLNMMDFFVRFELDKEFNETIKSRHRDVFSYYSFSEGEKNQIDIALLFAWRELTMLSGNALTNVVVLDEVFDSSLDDSTASMVMEILGNMNDETNIVVISHKPKETFDMFERVLVAQKIKNFSVMEEVKL